uniref:uncharacterized protein LOC122587682 n=1 Tax=Erigeron canadensis TaxID=72917 RepID=UPI001CB8ACA8|nr:uncharacterized protein LOC122587682 [Erigeron canadensis]
MTTSYKPYNTNYEVRSISLPTTSHPPSTHILEKEINDIKKWMLSPCKPSTICNGLMKLSTMYEGIHELIGLLSSIQAEKWVVEFMDKLVGFLDICGILKDILSQTKEQVIDLQYTLRRQKGNSSNLENNVAKYNCVRKKVKKDVKKLMACISKSKLVTSSNDRHHEHEVVIGMAMEVTVSLFEWLLMFIVMPLKETPKISKWFMVVSKLSRKTKVTCEEHLCYQPENDFEGLDVIMSRNECIKYDACRLERMEVQIERIEDNLDCICRRLIRTRVSLLNIVSNY